MVSANKLAYIPPLVGSCIGCIVARASVCHSEDNTLVWILADLSPIVRHPIAISEFDGIALDFKAGPEVHKDHWIRCRPVTT